MPDLVILQKRVTDIKWVRTEPPYFREIMKRIEGQPTGTVEHTAGFFKGLRVGYKYDYKKPRVVRRVVPRRYYQLRDGPSNAWDYLVLPEPEARELLEGRAT